MRLVLAFACLWSLTASAEVDETTGLIKSPGWEHVRANCGGCHSHALVTAQRADRNTWLDIIRWMQETQNLWQFQPEVEAEILDYLSLNYAPQANLRRAPLPPSQLPAPQPETPNPVQ